MNLAINLAPKISVFWKLYEVCVDMAKFFEIPFFMVNLGQFMLQGFNRYPEGQPES